GAQLRLLSGDQVGVARRDAWRRSSRSQPSRRRRSRAQERDLGLPEPAADDRPRGQERSVVRLSPTTSWYSYTPSPVDVSLPVRFPGPPLDLLVSLAWMAASLTRPSTMSESPAAPTSSRFTSEPSPR